MCLKKHRNAKVKWCRRGSGGGGSFPLKIFVFNGKEPVTCKCNFFIKKCKYNFYNF